jgi:hypothetical protein
MRRGAKPPETPLGPMAMVTTGAGVWLQVTTTFAEVVVAAPLRPSYGPNARLGAIARQAADA